MSESKSPSAKRREREKLRRRTEILSMASKLFADNGYDSTSMDEIAKQTGFTKATIYNYFPNKEDLFLEVSSLAFKNFNTILDKIEQKIISFEPLKTSIQDFIWNSPDDVFIMDSPKLRPLLVNIMKKEKNKQNLTEGEKLFRLEQLKSYNLVFNAIESIFDGLNVSSDLNPEIITNILSQIATALMVELVRREQLIKQSKEETSEVLNVFFRIFENGIKYY